MRTRIFLLFIAIPFLSINAQYKPGYHQCKIHRQDFHSKFKSTADIGSTHTANYDIVYHRIKWELDPAVQYISGVVTSYFKATKDNVSSVSFDLHDELTVDSITYLNSKLNFTHSQHIITVTLSKELNSSEVDSLTIYYQGSPTTSGFGSFETSTHSSTNDPVLWTLSEPYGAMEWWPCKQTLQDKIDSLDIFIETDAIYKAGSNGKLMAEEVNVDKKTTWWRHRHPIATYLVSLAVTNYEAFSDYAKLNETDSVEILNYVYPEKRSEWEIDAKYTVDVMQLLSELFIDYPYKDEKYGHAQFSWGGGMEHQTMSSMFNLSQGLVVHELAHQWFGDHVTCASWQDIWVNEGFAVFCEGLAVQNLHSAFDWNTWKKNEMDQVLSRGRTGSVYVDDTTNIGRIFSGTLTYTKGGLILHMLRYQIGDESFFFGINDMLTHQSTSGKFATGDDVKAFLESAADTTLDWFFDAWYYGEGYPEYTFKIKERTNDSIKFIISQSTTHPSVDFFPMHVPVQLSGNMDTIIKVHHTENEQEFAIKTGFLVTSLTFDPEREILAPHPANIIDSSLRPADEDNPVIIAPNPVSDVLRISVLNSSEVEKIALTDMSGRVVYLEDYKNNIGIIEVPVINLSSGQYILRIQTNNGTINRTIIKTD